MAFAIISIIIVGYMLYRVSRENRTHINEVITSKGGMLEKYSSLISYLKQGGCHVEKVTRDSIKLNSKTAVWYLDVIRDKLEIRVNGNMPVTGKFSQKWSYPHYFSQERMIDDIEGYLTWQMEQFSRALGNGSNIMDY